jgi:hypothetical protein
MWEQICLAMPLLLAGGSDLPPDWVLVKKDRFQVAMPAKPTEKNQRVKTAKEKLDVTLLIAEGRKDASFVVSHCDYADALVKKRDLERRLDQARDGAIESSGGKLRLEQMIELIDGDQRHLGRDLVIEKDGSVIARMRIFVVERRLYQVMVLGSPPTKDATVFLDSFRLTR